MLRRLALIALLLLASGLIGLSATVLPMPGVYALTACTDMSAIVFPQRQDDYNLFKPLSSTRPAALEVKLTEWSAAAFFWELKLGAPPQSRYLMVTRSKSKWFDAIYFDADGNNAITPEERLAVHVFQNTDYNAKGNRLDVWITRLIDPLAATVTYQRANRTTFNRSLTFSVDVFNFGTAQTSLESFCFGSITLDTWFIGELALDGGRLLKVAIVDGNQNGLFNEAKEDFILVDANFDSKFDWAKERQPLEDEVSGIGPDGKKAKLLPAVASWPHKLCLLAKGTAPDPSQLEAE